MQFNIPLSEFERSYGVAKLNQIGAQINKLGSQRWSQKLMPSGQAVKTIYDLE
jgi:hypothetical protein